MLVALDPSGGGSSSMSLLTTCIYQSRITVVAFDEAPISGVAEMEIMIMRHVTAVLRRYPNHWLIFALESNLGQEAAHAQAMLQRHRVARHYCIREKHRIGVLTTAARKALYADNLRFYLEQDAIGLREPCVLTGNPPLAKSTACSRCCTSSSAITGGLPWKPRRVGWRNGISQGK